MTTDTTRRAVLRAVGVGSAAGFAAIGSASAKRGGGVAETDGDRFVRKAPWEVVEVFGPFEVPVSCMSEDSADRPLYAYIAEYRESGVPTFVLTRKPLAESGTYRFDGRPIPCKVAASDFPSVQTSYVRVR